MSRLSSPSPATQSRMQIARSVCIFFMIYAHVNPIALEFAPDLHGIRTFDYLRMMIITVFSSASVALLSVISGYLVVFSLERYPLGDFIRKRVNGLVIPLILWNVIFILLFLGGDLLKPGNSVQSFGVLSISRLPDLLLGLTGDPANIPLGFFRDVFVCMMVAPLILATQRKGAVWMALLVLGLYIAALYTPFLLRPNLIIFFAIGIYLATLPRLPDLPSWLTIASWTTIAILGAVLTQMKLTDPMLGVRGSDPLIDVLRFIIRFPAVIAFWSLATWLSPRDIGQKIGNLDTYMFFTFCAHTSILPVLWTLWQLAFLGYYHPVYPAFFFTGPALVFAVSIIGTQVMNSATPALFSILNGGRKLTPSHRALPRHHGTTAG